MYIYIIEHEKSQFWMYKILSRVQIGSYQVGFICVGFFGFGSIHVGFVFMGKKISDSKNSYKFLVQFRIGYFCISSSLDFRLHIKMPMPTRYSVFNQQYGTSSEIIIFLLAFLLLIFPRFISFLLGVTFFLFSF